MSKILKRTLIFTIIILIITLTTSVISVGAISFPCDVKTYSQSIYMVNLDSGMVVYDKDSEVQHMPAGLVKIMDFVIASEFYDDYNTEIKVDQEINDYLDEHGMVTSGLYDHGGDKLKVVDILYNLIMSTGHDSALVLADNICDGDNDDFVRMMNDKAHELKMDNTVFTNCTGIDDKDQYTTCVDMYKLTKYALTLPMFSKIVNTTEYYIADDKDPIITTNYLIDMNRGGEYSYLYATGVKTTGTTGAGRCLVSTATYEGYSYLIVSMNAPFNVSDEDDKEYCMLEAADLYRWAFINLQFKTYATSNTPICEQKVDHAWNTESILLVPENDINIILPSDYNESDISVIPDNDGSISAPVGKGDFVTTATLLYKNEPYTKINLVANDDVQLSPILYTTDIIKSILTSVWFLVAVGIVVVLFIIYVIISQSYSKKKERINRKK